MRAPARDAALCRGALLGACLSALLSLGGCTVTTERFGDPHYITQAAKFEWRTGVTSALEVAQSLGPPDEIRRRGEEMWFFYRFQDRRTSTLVLTYYLNVFQRRSVHVIDSQLVVTFDAHDRLLTHGVSGLPDEGQFLRHFD